MDHDERQVFRGAARAIAGIEKPAARLAAAGRTGAVSALLVCGILALTGSAQTPERPAAVVGSRSIQLPGPAQPSGSGLQANPPTGTGLILGRVVDAAGGRPVAGAVVTLTGVGLPRSVITEEQGRFVFRDLPTGSVSISATKSGWSPGGLGRRRPAGPAQPLTLADGQRLDDVTIVVWRHGAIGGTVRDETGDPLVAVQVRALIKTVRTGDTRWTTAGTAMTDDRGMYRLASLVPAEYTVVVPSTQMATPIGGTGGPGRAGFVTRADGQMMAVAAAPRTDTAIAAGDYLLSSGIPATAGREQGRPYAYRTVFYPDALTSSEATRLAIGSGEDRSGIDFVLTPVKMVAVSGTAMSPTGPAPNLNLQLLRAAPGGDGRLRAISDIEVATTVSAQNGSFVFPAVAPGQFVLRAAGVDQVTPGPQLALWAKMPIVVADGDIAGLMVVLRRGFVVSGRVEFEGSGVRPGGISRLQVTVEALDPRDGITRTGEVQADGRFAVPGVPASEYMIRIAASLPGWPSASIRMGGRDMTDRAIDIGGDLNGVDVVFSDLRTEIRGRVIGAAGADPDASVIVFPAGGFPLTEVTWANGSRRFRADRVDRAGEYVISGLTPGEYFVAAVPDELAADWMDVAFLAALSRVASVITLTEGQRAQVDLRTTQVSR